MVISARWETIDTRRRVRSSNRGITTPYVAVGATSRKEEAADVREIVVAIADPFPLLREGLVARLETEPDLRVVGIAASEGEVESVVDSLNPAVLVLDEEMGDENGVEIIRLLAAKLRHPAIVVLGRQESSDCAVAAIRGGASAYVSKDAGLHELLSAIRWADQGEIWVSPRLLRAIFDRVGPRGRNGNGNGEKRIAALNNRELEILEFLVDGLGLADIASKLNLSLNTVRTYAGKIQSKLGVHSNVAAVSVALQAGIHPR